MFTKRRKPKQATQVVTPQEAAKIVRQDELAWLKRQFPIDAEFSIYKYEGDDWEHGSYVKFKVRFLDSERWELIDDK